MKSFHSGTVKKSILVCAPKQKVWNNISNIIGLPKWVTDVKSCRFKTRNKRGVGAVREITLADKNKIEEHIVAWSPGESFSYIAVSGLPLRAYVATISLTQKNKNTTRITWQSYLSSKKMSKKEFNEFLAFMGSFYQDSLKNLKSILDT